MSDNNLETTLSGLLDTLYETKDLCTVLADYCEQVILSKTLKCITPEVLNNVIARMEDRLAVARQALIKKTD